MAHVMPRERKGGEETDWFEVSVLLAVLNKLITQNLRRNWRRFISIANLRGELAVDRIRGQTSGLFIFGPSGDADKASAMSLVLFGSSSQIIADGCPLMMNRDILHVQMVSGLQGLISDTMISSIRR